MKSIANLESTLIGVAGEYYVAAELTMRGHIATITLRNSGGIDIIASNSDASKSVSIQVKKHSLTGYPLKRGRIKQVIDHTDNALIKSTKNS